MTNDNHNKPASDIEATYTPAPVNNLETEATDALPFERKPEPKVSVPDTQLIDLAALF